MHYYNPTEANNRSENVMTTKNIMIEQIQGRISVIETAINELEGVPDRFYVELDECYMRIEKLQAAA
jgi:chromosome segregation ATPase